jgi:hypothetical protein
LSPCVSVCSQQTKKKNNKQGKMNYLNRAAATERQEDDVAACSICFLPFSASEADHMPRLLQCGHSFCTACLTRLLGSTTVRTTNADPEAEPQAKCLRCPKCRTATRVLLVDGEAATEGVQRLPRNFDLIDLLASPVASDQKQCPRRPAQSCGLLGCGRVAERFCEQCYGAQLHALLSGKSRVRVSSADALEPRADYEPHRGKEVEICRKRDEAQQRTQLQLALDKIGVESQTKREALLADLDHIMERWNEASAERARAFTAIDESNAKVAEILAQSAALQKAYKEPNWGDLAAYQARLAATAAAGAASTVVLVVLVVLCVTTPP